MGAPGRRRGIEKIEVQVETGGQKSSLSLSLDLNLLLSPLL
jgi:hypothetical protein